MLDVYEEGWYEMVYIGKVQGEKPGYLSVHVTLLRAKVQRCYVRSEMATFE